MRRPYPTVMLIVVVAAFWCLALTPAPAAAACVPPTIDVQPVTVPPGGTVTVTGRDFFVGCDDTAAPGEPLPERPGPPDTNIELVFEQNGSQQTLRVVAADESFQFTSEVAVPTSSSSGHAVIRAIAANGSPEASITIAPAEGGERTVDEGPAEQMSDLPETGSSLPAVAMWVGGVTLLAGLALTVSRAVVVRRR